MELQMISESPPHKKTRTESLTEGMAPPPFMPNLPSTLTNEPIMEEEKNEARYERAIALFEYITNKPGKLNFKISDEILVMIKEESGWWFGNNFNNNEAGWFPSSFVKLAESTPVKMVIAVSDFESSQKERRISLKKGEHLLVYKEHPSGWWNGKNLVTNQIGWFPASHVKSVESMTNEGMYEEEEEEEEEYEAEGPTGEEQEESFLEPIEPKTEELSKTCFTPYFTTEEEDTIVEWIETMTKQGMKILPKDVRNHAWEMAQAKDPNRRSFSKKWWTGFKRRHPEISVHERVMGNPRGQRVLSTGIEEKVAEWVRQQNDAKKIPTRSEVINKAISFNPSKDHLSRGWVIGFQKRNPQLQIQVNATTSSTYFTAKEEQEIVDWIKNEVKNTGKFPKGVNVRSYAVKLSEKKANPKKTFGYDWYNTFRIRHPELQTLKNQTDSAANVPRTNSGEDLDTSTISQMQIPHDGNEVVEGEAEETDLQEQPPN